MQALRTWAAVATLSFLEGHKLYPRSDDLGGMIPGFATFQFSRVESVKSGSLVVFGVSSDPLPPSRAGTADGPAALREASVEQLQPYFESPSGSVVDLHRGITRKLRPGEIGFDLGDIELVESERETAKNSVAVLTSQILDRGGVPVVLGGDGLAADGMSQAVFQEAPETALIRFAPKVPSPDQTAVVKRSALLCIGINGLQPLPAWKSVESGNHSIRTSTSIDDRGVETVKDEIQAFLDKHSATILHIDMGVLDTGHAAGTPIVNVGGLTPEQLVELLGAISGHELAGVVITNTAPGLDARGITEHAAAAGLLAAIGGHLLDEVRP